MKQLSILIPVFNETDNVEPLYEEIVSQLPENRFEFEIIFIDDGSQDGTSSRLQSIKQKDKRVRFLQHRRNYGQSTALVSGAKAARYPLLVTLDGDGQNDPADIASLCEYISDLHTVVLGIRKKREDNYIRRFSSFVANRVRMSFLRDHCVDTNCSLKIFPREAFLNLPHFNHLHRFLPALFLRAGLKLITAPVNHRPRQHGVSKYGIRNRLFVGLFDLIGVKWLMHRPCQAELIHDEQ